MNSKDQSGVWLTLQSDTEVVKEPLRIVRLLKDVRDTHALVTVTIPERNQIYNSAILEIDSDKSEILLDELTPPEGHQQLLESRELSAYARVRGVGVYFRTSLREAGIENNIAFYRAGLPQMLFYGQKRSHYRVRVGLGQLAPVMLTEEEKSITEGQLRDLSVGGIGASFPSGVPIKVGDRFASCLIELPGGGAISCAIEVRFAQVDPQHRQMRVGACFVNLDAAQERMVRRCVTELEREAIRKQPREE